MNLPIKNINDLQVEIERLKVLETEQSMALKVRFKSPSAVFSTILSMFPKEVNADGSKKQGFFDQDMVGIISRFALPFTLNKTLFRNSNFLIKTLVGLVSQKASHFITDDSVTSVWDKAKSLFNSFSKSKPNNDAPLRKVTPAM